MQIKIEDNLYKQISEYCKLNNLKINHYVNELLQKEFSIDKYGIKPLVRKHPVIKKEPIEEPKTIVVEEPKQEPIIIEKVEEEKPIVVVENNNETIEEEQEIKEEETVKPKKRKLK